MRNDSNGERAYGPYKHRQRWRVVIVGEDGGRRRRSFESRELALEYIALFASATDTRTVSAAVDDYIAHKRAQGLRDGSIVTLKFRLKAMLRTNEHERSMRSLTVSVARGLFDRRCGETKPETQRQELKDALAFAVWSVGRGWLESNPFEGIEPSGARAARKPQLHFDEARKLVEVCLAEGTRAAIAVAMAIKMGARASEITKRVVRDVDDGARILWIENAKTEAGDRHLEVPDELQAPLAALTAGRSGGERLFGDVDRHWLHYHCKRLCRAAEVPEVTPHGLRGTWCSAGAERTTVDHVARGAGHAHTSVTNRHYVRPGAERIGQQRAALRVLRGGR